MIKFKTKVKAPGEGWTDQRLALMRDTLPLLEPFKHQRILHKLKTELQTKHDIRLITYERFGTLHAEIYRYNKVLHSPSSYAFKIESKTPTAIADALAEQIERLSTKDALSISDYRIEKAIIEAVHYDELSAEELKHAVALTVSELRRQADALERGEWTHG